jgi:AraC-like DNA-binding protein
MIEKEKVLRHTDDLLLLGPGIPHYGIVTKFPMSFITIYFLPWVPIEMGPEHDGVRILRRFTAQQPPSQRLFRTTPKNRAEFQRDFREIYNEFSQRGFGREARLRTLLMEILVKIVRCEQALGCNIGEGELELDWQPILKVLKFLRENYSEPIYSLNIARAAGLSESRLKRSFQKALGVSWLTFLQGYRIHRAAALMNDGSHNVTEAAMAVGFDSLSHFNVTFRSFMGTSPKNYTGAKRPKESDSRFGK